MGENTEGNTSHANNIATHTLIHDTRSFIEKFGCRMIAYGYVKKNDTNCVT